MESLPFHPPSQPQGHFHSKCVQYRTHFLIWQPQDESDQKKIGRRAIHDSRQSHARVTEPHAATAWSPHRIAASLETVNGIANGWPNPSDSKALECPSRTPALRLMSYGSSSRDKPAHGGEQVFRQADHRSGGGLPACPAPPAPRSDLNDRQRPQPARPGRMVARSVSAWSMTHIKMTCGQTPADQQSFVPIQLVHHLRSTKERHRRSVKESALHKRIQRSRRAAARWERFRRRVQNAQSVAELASSRASRR